MSTILILAEPLPLDRVRAWAEERGLVCTHDVPYTEKRRTVSFADEGGGAIWMSHAGSPKAVLVVHGEKAAEIEAAARAAFALVPLDALIARVAAATSPVDRIRAAFDLGALTGVVDREERRRAFEALGPLLADDDRAVRYAVAHLISSVVDRGAAALLAAAAERHEDMAPLRDRMRAACDAEADGTLHDGPTDSWWELERRAREGAAAGQWKRVLKAANELLEENETHVAGLYYRGLVYEAQGYPVMALASLGAAFAQGTLEVKVHDDGKKGEAIGEDEKAEERALLRAIDARIEEARAKGIPEERWAASRDALIERLASTWKEHPICALGTVAALRGLGGDLDALFTFVEGACDLDVEKLERALALAPDSIAVAMKLAAGLVRKGDKAAAAAVYERVLGRLRAGDTAPASPAAELVERVEKAPASLAGVLEELSVAAFQAGERRRAMELADELVKVDPDVIRGWTVRGHARLFELMYAEAAEAYAEGIREVSRIMDQGDKVWFGDDPRPAMHFNRACAFGRLGMKEEALEALRHAVRGAEKYAEEAKTEEWIECLRGTPELEAITRQEPRALVTKDELDEAHVKRLITRCRGGFFGGERDAAIEAGERAVMLAEMRRDPRQEVDALTALAFPLAFTGQAGRAVEISAKAVALAEGGPPKEHAEAVAIHGSALFQHGDLEGAERTQLRALELRREAYGEDAPVLAKSYGDLARVYGEQGRPTAEVCAMHERGLAVVTRYLASHTEEDDDWAEAVDDRATIEANLAHIHAQQGALEECVAMLEACAATFEAAVRGSAMNPNVLEGTHELAERVASASAAPEHAARAGAAAARMAALRFPGPPAVRRERAFFAGLRKLVGQMRAVGLEDAAIAELLQDAARGRELPSPYDQVTALASLASEIAARGAKWPTFVVMSAMSLELMSTDLDGALKNLEELAAAHAMEDAG